MQRLKLVKSQDSDRPSTWDLVRVEVLVLVLSGVLAGLVFKDFLNAVSSLGAPPPGMGRVSFIAGLISLPLALANIVFAFRQVRAKLRSPC